ncbi:hypothetical protein [Methanolobus profundi]|nr:hypothetical protein [Methanolobus profundi]
MDDDIHALEAVDTESPTFEGDEGHSLLDDQMTQTDDILDDIVVGDGGSSGSSYAQDVKTSGYDVSPENIVTALVPVGERYDPDTAEDLGDVDEIRIVDGAEVPLSSNEDDNAVDDHDLVEHDDAVETSTMVDTGPDPMLLSLEEKVSELQIKLDEALDQNQILLSSLDRDVRERADGSEFNRLKRDFDQFSKRLKRVVQAEDSVNAEALDATKVPPDVLEITYAKTLNDLYHAMLDIYGDSEAEEMVEEARDNVRQFSAGVDFFRFEEGSFIVRGLSDAIASKIVSVKQIHGTYIELFKMLFQHVPNYNSQDFRAFVETGSREYTIEKVVSHEGHIDRIVSDITKFRDELSNITENVSFIAELQNNQLEEMDTKCHELDEIREQMKSIAKAVNLHTKAINKLNVTLKEFQSNAPAMLDHAVETVVVPESVELDRIEEMVVSKANMEDIVSIANEMESFKANVEGMFASMQQQIEENMLSSEKLKGIENELSGVQEEIQHMHVAEETQPVRLADIPIEDVITGQLSILGSATLKQLEKQINEQGFSIDHEKLSLVMSYLEQEKLVTSMKKGRYTFYSVSGPVSI